MAKRLFDIIFSLIGLIIFCPIFLVIIFLIKLKMPDGPIIFKQQRIGQFGEPFTIFKFRTMVNCHVGSTVSIRGESRITPFGSFLRKYKLDELPELWNVLLGNMSFVGPRPDVPGYADKLKGEERKILNLKPGITGPASLKYLNEEEILAGQLDPIGYNNRFIWPDKVKINYKYYEKHNLFLDLKIIAYTLFRKKTFF